ncbi:Tll0287-like domain-containing protein [Magnetococcus sp. PR-3]|uniref:Tll0287-like domain-containing protein n=1 Tax=Magnetococcus sp. PR-3 TaxID=3120355 RepID=UPI002FCE2CA4
MKITWKAHVVGALTLVAALSAQPALAVDEMAMVTESRGAVKMFFGKLKGTLMQGMKSGGPGAAATLCNSAAGGIGNMASKNYGGTVARTSLKVRNPDNAPDAWERKVLESFDARLAAGEDPKKMEHHEVVMVNDQKVFRYMKAIPTAAKPCLACHGEKIHPKAEVTLSRLYPNDKARGYKAGQIRGAFTLKKEIK